MEITQDSSEGILKFAGTLDIGASDALRESLRAGMQQQGAIILDLSSVEAFDTTALQLILSARKTAGQCGKEFRVKAASEPVLTMCAALGIVPEDLSIDAKGEHAV